MSVALKSLMFPSFFSLSCRMRRAMSGASWKVARNFTSWFVAQVTSKKSPHARRYLRSIRWDFNDLKSASAIKLRKRRPKRQAALLRGGGCRLPIQELPDLGRRDGHTLRRRSRAEPLPSSLDPDQRTGRVVQPGTGKSRPSEGGRVDPSVGIAQDPPAADEITDPGGIADVENLLLHDGLRSDADRRLLPRFTGQERQVQDIIHPHQAGILAVHPDRDGVLNHVTIGEDPT